MKKIILLFTLFFISYFFVSPFLLKLIKKEFILNINENIQGEIFVEEVSGNPFYEVEFNNIFLLSAKREFLKVDKINIKYNLLKILLNRDLLSGISDIKIQKPRICISREKEGVWNYEKLIKKGVSYEKPPPFYIKIKISEGEIDFSDYFKKNFSKLFKNIFGEISSENYPHLFFNLYCNDDSDKSEKRIIIKGKTNILTLASNLNIYATKQDLKYTGNYFLDFPYLKFTSGKFNTSFLLYISKDKEIDYFGEIKINEGSLNYSNYSFSKLKGNFVLNNYALNINKLNFNFKKDDFLLKGVIFDFNDPKLNLNLFSPSFSLKNLEKFSNKIKISGRGKINLQIKGKAENPEIEGEFNGDVIRIFAKDVFSPILTFKYYDNKIEIPYLKGKLFGGEIQSFGVIDLKKNKNIFFIEGENITSSALSSQLNIPTKVSGKINGNLIISSSSPLKIFGNLELNKGKIADFPFDVISSNFNYKNSSLSILSLIGKRKDTKILSSGEVKGEDLDLNLAFEKLPLYNLKFKNLNPSGIANFCGLVEGKISSPTLSGDLDINNARIDLKLRDKIKPLKFDEIEGVINLSKDAFSSKEITLRDRSGIYNLKGNLDFIDKKINLELEAKNTEVKEIQGNLSGKFNIFGSFDDLQGTLNLKNSKIFDRKIDEVATNFSVKDKKIFVKNFSAKLENSEISSQGYFNLKNEKIFLEVKGKNLLLDKFNIYPELKGITNLKGEIKGSFNYPIFSGNISSSDLSFREKKFKEFLTNFCFYKNLLEFETNFSSKEENYLVSGNIKKTQENFFEVSCFGKIKNGDLETILPLFKLERDDTDIKGKVSLVSEFKGKISKKEDKVKIENHYLKLKFYTSQTRIAEYPSLYGEGEISMENNLININKFNLLNNETKISSSGKIDLHGDINLKVIGEKINLNFLKNYLHKNIDGNLSFSTDIFGQTNSPEIKTILEANNLKLENIDFDKFQGSSVFKENVIYLSNFTLRKGKEIAYLFGEIPFSYNMKKIPEDKEMDLYFQCKEGNLSFLTDIFKNIKNISGNFSTLIHICGPINQLKIDGQTEITCPKLQFSDLETPIENLEGKIIFKENNIIFQKLSANLGGGNLSILGNLEREGLSLKKYDLSIIGENLAISCPPSFRGIGSANIIFQGTRENPKVVGTINIKNANYALLSTISSFDFKTIPLPSKTSLDLKLKVDRNVWIKNSSLRMETTGELSLRGNLEQPRIYGELTSSRGTIAYFDTLFKLKESTIFFEKIESIEPSIFAKAETVIEVKDITGKLENLPIYLILDGPISEPERRLEYDDSKLGYRLTQSKVIACLAHQEAVEEFFKGDVEKILAEETNKLFRANLSFRLFEPLGQKIEEAFNLKEFQLEYDVEKNIQVKIGKYISKTFSLSYAKTFSVKQEGLFTFEYEFLPNKVFSIQTDEKQYSKYMIGLKYKF